MAIPTGRWGAVLVALSVALLAGGCGGASGGPDERASAAAAAPNAAPGKPATEGVRLPRPAPEPGTSPAGVATDEGASHGAGVTDPGAPRYITGLGLTGVQQTLERAGLECSQTDASELGEEWSCWATSEDGTVDYSVVIDATDEHRVRHLTALVTQFGTPDAALAGAFLGGLAATSYRGARPDEARAWVAGWLAGEEGVPSDVTIGHAALSLAGTLESCSLDIAAPDAIDE